MGKTVGGTGYDNASNICVDVNNTIYTGGKFQNTVDFDPSPATYNLTAAGGDEALLPLIPLMAIFCGRPNSGAPVLTSLKAWCNRMDSCMPLATFRVL
ncbi:MAG: hypothetical protein IPO83_05380 [Chitinophagaceae bacterium]|nr:hypothetical protein [Chitinophagaceae bacterium]